jgi:hypothetical protein
MDGNAAALPELASTVSKEVEAYAALAAAYGELGPLDPDKQNLLTGATVPFVM